MHLQLAEDFYAMSFLGYKKSIREEYQVSRSQQAKNFYSCLWIFLIQSVLVYLIVKTIVIDDDHFTIATPTVYVFLCRFICSLLLHMELFEDVKQGQAMLLYLNLHTDEFDSTVIPYAIATM